LLLQRFWKNTTVPELKSGGKCSRKGGKIPEPAWPKNQVGFD
jgi:hypothetical protein